MIKYLRYIFVAAIAMMAVTSCQDPIEDSFSKKPTAPVLNNNGTILMTQNTMTEDVVWSWKAARFLKGDATYTLFVQYGEEAPKQVGEKTSALTVTMTKPAFHTLVNGFTGVSKNASYDVIFYVVANDGVTDYPSEKQLVKVYAYGDAVSPVATAKAPEVILDITNPILPLEMLTWAPARLTYGEAITYAVFISYGEEGRQVEVAKDLTETTCTKTIDEWNELVVSAGAPEATVSDVKFTVMAFSKSYADGVPSQAITIKVTTYIATYPEYLYVPGSHQGWNAENAKGIPHSTLTKGLFECYMDLTTTDGTDVEFKFNPDKAWNNNDFGGSGVEVVNDKDGNIVITGKMGGSDNIKVPSGFYRISANRKLNTLEMIKIESMGMIGNATVGGWDKETAMTYDAATNTYSVLTTMTKDGEYKFRANNNWGYAIGDNGSFTGGENSKFVKETGEYKIVLDVNKHPYAVKILSTSFPEKLYIPGAHQGWAEPFGIALIGNGEGLFEGGVNLVDKDGKTNCEWKFSPKSTWGEDFGGPVVTFNEKGLAKGTYGGSNNISVPSGYYYIKVDMTAGTFELQHIAKVGLIGDFNAWGGDAEFAYDTTKNVWTLTQALVGNKDFKVRFNADWDVNRGVFGDPAVVVLNTVTPVCDEGGNMKVTEDGTYTFTLDMTTNPNTIKITK